MRRLVERIRRAFAPPGIRRMIDMGDKITASWIAQGIHAVAALGVADNMSRTPVSIADLAAAVNANEDALYRVLRMLAPAGLFEEHSQRRFSLTELGALLQTGNPNSMRGFAVYNGVPWHWGMWGELADSVRTGAPAPLDGAGTSLFDFLARHADAAATFDAAMADLSNARDVSAISGYDFGRFKMVVDVGGGEGRLVKSVLASFPGVSGVLYDLPDVIERAVPRMIGDGFAPRCTLVPGNFFESVPAGADAYLLKQVLHDWPDDKAAAILRNCQAAMDQNAVVLIIEMLVPDSDEPSLAKLADIEMLVATGGRERTLTQYDALLSAAGLRRTGTHRTRSPFTIIEARRDLSARVQVERV